LSIRASANAAGHLPHAVVVTFTNRAADECNISARGKLWLEGNLRQEVQTAFNRAFFGTIIRFTKLLTDFGHYLVLPAPWSWSKTTTTSAGVLQKTNSNGRSLRRQGPRYASAFVQARDLMELAPTPRASCVTRATVAHVRLSNFAVRSRHTRQGQ